MSLRENGCSEKDILDPESQHTAAGKGRNLSPQKIKLDLRPGQSHTFQVEVKLPRKPRPLGVYVLTSFSMNNKGRGSRAKVLANKFIEGIAKSNKDQQVHLIGYGLFGNTVVTDKRQKECEESGVEVCEPELYATHSTADPHNPFSPYFPWRSQGGLQALMQVALCKDVIHWGDHQRVIVYASDGRYDLAPETETRNLDTLNSSICLMNNSYIRTTMRPPSVSELRDVLVENNIQVIFVTEDDLLLEYYGLNAKLAKSSVAWVDTSDPDSAPIEKAFENLSTSLVLTHLPVPGLSVTYDPLCDSFHRRNHSGICYVRGRQIMKSQTFNVTVLADSCELPASFEIKNLGSEESLTVELTARCKCECGDQPDPEFCSYAGHPVCGQCRCNEGHFGSRCECSINDDVTPCTERQGAPVCSGRGTCVCSQCECHRGVYGRFCECDDSSCPTFGGQLCGGNGMCVCGRCACTKDYVGNACDCSTKVDGCQSPNGMLCSGRGICECNQCVCGSAFKGALCDE